MKLNVLKNRYRIELANEDFFMALNKSSINLGENRVRYEYFENNIKKCFHEESDIYLLNEQNIWFSYITKNYKSFFAFGINKPKNNDSYIPLYVLDFSLKGIDSDCKGIYAQNDKAKVSVLLRNNDTEFINNLYSKISNSRLSKIDEFDNKNYFFVICNLYDQQLTEKIKDFIYNMKMISNSNIQDNPTDEKINVKETNYTICKYCGKNISDEVLDLNSSYIDFPNNQKTCLDCLEKIYSAKALKEIKKYVSLRLFNEKNLFKKVEDPKIFKSYLTVLKKQEILKCFNKGSYYLDKKIDLNRFIETYSNINYERNISDNLKQIVKSDYSKKIIENNSNFQSEPSNKICEVCKKVLTSNQFYRNDKNDDGLSQECRNCTKRKKAAHGLKEILKFVNCDQEFSKDILIEKSIKLPSTISQYLWDLQYLGLIKRNKTNDKYFIKMNDKLKEYCKEFKIPLDKEIKSTNTNINIKEINKQIKLLNHHNWTIRRTAANKLGKFANKRATIHLINALDDDNVFVKLNAIISLGKIGDERAIKPLNKISTEKNLNKSAILAIEQIESIKISDDSSNSSVKHNKSKLKVCSVCGEELLLSEFYKNRNNPDGLTNNCKKCLKEKRASNALKEIIKQVNFNSSFSKEKLKMNNISKSTMNAYINDLVDLGLLDYNSSKDNYNLVWNDKLCTFCKKNNIKSPKIDFISKDSLSKSNRVDLKLCNSCKESLPYSEFYNNKIYHDGLSIDCKNCIKEKRTVNAFKELLKYVNFNVPFSKDKIKKQINKSNHTIMSYLRDLTDLGFLETTQSSNGYILIWNDDVRRFFEKYSIQSLKIPKKSKNSLFKPIKNDLKICEACGNELNISEVNNINNSDDLINYCSDCQKELNASKGLADIICFFSINSTFPRKILEMKSNNSKNTIAEYLIDLLNLNLLEFHNKEKEIYSFILNDNLISFCKKYNIKLPESKEYQMDYSINTKYKPVADLKICDVCKKQLPINKFLKENNSPDGLSGKCINCLMIDNGVEGIREIIKYFNIDEPFSKEIFYMKSEKSKITINNYFQDLEDMEFLTYDKSNKKYMFIINDKLKLFCQDNYIILENPPWKTEIPDIVNNNDITNQITQISKEKGKYLNLELRQRVKQLEIIPILTEIEKKFSNLKLLELLVKPENDDKYQDYIIQVKVEILSEDLNDILKNLKSLDKPMKSQIEIFGLMKLKF